MSGQDDAVRELERRLRREAPPGGGLSDEARARLRDRLAHTAPEPGAPSGMGGRGVLIAGAAMVAVVVTAVAVSRQGSSGAAPGDESTPRMVEDAPEGDSGPVFSPGFGDGLRDRFARLSERVTQDRPVLDEARRIAMDLETLRGVFVRRASVFDLRADKAGG